MWLPLFEGSGEVPTIAGLGFGPGPLFPRGGGYPCPVGDSVAFRAPKPGIGPGALHGLSTTHGPTYGNGYLIEQHQPLEVDGPIWGSQPHPVYPIACVEASKGVVYRPTLLERNQRFAPVAAVHDQMRVSTRGDLWCGDDRPALCPNNVVVAALVRPVDREVRAVLVGSGGLEPSMCLLDLRHRSASDAVKDGARGSRCYHAPPCRWVSVRELSLIHI